jgi:hypothetical protein
MGQDTSKWLANNCRTDRDETAPLLPEAMEK